VIGPPRGAGSSAADMIPRNSSFHKSCWVRWGMLFSEGWEKSFPVTAAGLQPVAIRILPVTGEPPGQNSQL